MTMRLLRGPLAAGHPVRRLARSRAGSTNTRARRFEGRREHRGKQEHPTQFPLKPKHKVELLSLGLVNHRTAEAEGGLGHVSQRMAINGHRVGKKGSQVTTFWARWMDRPRGAQGKGCTIIGKLREPVSFGWVLVCLCQTRAPPIPDPLVTSRIKNGYGVFIPKSVSGSGEAVFR